MTGQQGNIYNGKERKSCIRSCGAFSLCRPNAANRQPQGIENSKHQAPKPDLLSPDEMERILAHMKKHTDQRVWADFEFAFMTGMRPEELIALRAQVNPTYVARQMGHANAKMLFTVMQPGSMDRIWGERK